MLSTAELQVWIASWLTMSLRIAPVFVFAPPFSLTRVPRLFHVFFGLGLAFALVAADPSRRLTDLEMSTLVPAAGGELMLGVSLVLVMQLCFAALSWAGRLVDIQAGFGLATVIDPVSHAPSPLVGTLFAYAAGALFFSMGGHLELLRLIALSLEAAPLGQWHMPASLDHLTACVSSIFVVGLGVAGAAVLVLFLIDMAIAMLSRTIPQMNVLILGFQVKTIALLLALPVCFGAGGALMLRMIRITLEAMPGFF